MNKSFEDWWQSAPAELKKSCSQGWAHHIWQAAKTDPDPATVALYFGYEVTMIGDQVFIAKNNAAGKVWVPFSRESHPKQFREYDRCS